MRVATRPLQALTVTLTLRLTRCNVTPAGPAIVSLILSRLPDAVLTPDPTLLRLPIHMAAQFMPSAEGIATIMEGYVEETALLAAQAPGDFSGSTSSFIHHR